MNDLEQAMMNEPNDSTSEDIPSHTERRLLIVVLCLSYLACLAGLWLIGNLPGQTHAVLPGIFGLGQNMRFALLAVPLVGLCASYFRLRHLTGKIMHLPERKLDERQRMVRNRAHRIAYRIITMLCLAILAYICVHSMLLSATPPTTTGGVTNAHPAPKPIFPRPVMSEVISIREFPSKIPHIFIQVTPLQVALQGSIVYWVIKPEVQNTPAAPSSIDLVNLGLYYGLFLVTMVLIVKTLPTAVIGWKERG
jgi:hypothetical protein